MQKNFLYRNLANVTSILGVLPLVLLFFDDGYRFVIPLILFNNVMDDLDGVLAAKLDIRSRFGANLDNVCDAVAHVALALSVGAHFGGIILIVSAIAAGSIILRATSRLNSEAATGGGSPTNELMRHLLFILLLEQPLGFEPGSLLIPLFLLHTVSMLIPYKMPALIRGWAKSATAIGAVNAALIAAWLIPSITLFIAGAFALTYLYSFVVEGARWLRGRAKSSVRE